MNNEAKQRMDGDDEPHWGDVAKFFRGNFNTLLGHEDEWRFQVWMDAGKLKDLLDDYDLRGAWKESAEHALEAWPARWRKPNHVLFDTSSLYHGTPDTQHGNEYAGGDWVEQEDGQQAFRPSAHMLDTTHPCAWLKAVMRTEYPHISLCINKDDSHE